MSDRFNHDPESVAWALSRSGMTQRAFADALDMGYSSVSEMLSGKRNMTHATLIRAAEILNCPIAVLERKRPLPVEEGLHATGGFRLQSQPAIKIEPNGWLPRRAPLAVGEVEMTLRMNPDHRPLTISVVHGQPVGSADGEQSRDLVSQGIHFRCGQVLDEAPVDERVADVSHDSSSPVAEGASTPTDPTVDEAAGGTPTSPGVPPEGGAA